MTGLKARLRADLTTAMKSRDNTTVATLRMALAAISTEEVSGDAAHELSDEQIQKVLARELRKRKEAAEAFATAGRADQAAAERAEAGVLTGYLPEQLGDDELTELVTQAVAEVTEQLGERPGMRQMGQVMKAATAKVAGRAEGARIAAAVKSALG